MLARRPFQALGAGMSVSESQLSFDTSPVVWVLACVAWIAVCFLAAYAWRRSHYDRAVGALELLRVMIATLTVATLLQPEWQDTHVPEQRPVLAILKDVSGSMQTRDVVEEGNAVGALLSRAAWMQSQLDALPLDRLDASVRVVQEPFGASRAGAEISSATDLDTALDAVGQQYEHLRAVIVLSDGDWNQGDSPANSATRYRVRNVPIYTVTLGRSRALTGCSSCCVRTPDVFGRWQIAADPFYVE